MSYSQGSGADASRNPISPLPSGLQLDLLIDHRLAKSDAVPRPIRDAAFTVALIMMQLSRWRALTLLGTASRLLEEQRAEN